jgi:hypothetical protein
MAPGVTRRRLLMATGAIAGISAIGPMPATAGDGPMPAAASGQAGGLLRLLPDRAAAARIGRSYLAAAPEEASVDRLVALLDLPDGGDAAKLFEAKRRMDFREGRTVPVEGWRLAVTEARLCALAALA